MENPRRGPRPATVSSTGRCCEHSLNPRAPGNWKCSTGCPGPDRPPRRPPPPPPPSTPRPPPPPPPRPPPPPPAQRQPPPPLRRMTTGAGRGGHGGGKHAAGRLQRAAPADAEGPHRER